MNRDGFTLLEVLVALAILALGLAAVMGGIGDRLDHVSQARSRARAVVAAQSLLAGAGVDAPLRPGRQSGALPDGSGWSLEARPGPDSMLVVTATVDPPGRAGRVRLVTLMAAGE